MISTGKYNSASGFVLFITIHKINHIDMLSRIHIHLKKLWEMNLMKLKHNTRKENLRVHRNSREERKTRYE